ncbi:uncharacterized protein LOC111703594 [Eurytemora carolleeae]|uniref:uncharacterized protein LOC111703594 n=1 Tax=Eurytemora carolleeae TaxID=1294199 RepID=UPI000C78A1A5|nr:uncharacterized protein LOC111703594 [Eurytemora carolleeae]|eukprot:XP_023331348.1 uncharacterized protein LOC111703594 [Eurytemora affinis]
MGLFTYLSSYLYPLLNVLNNIQISINKEENKPDSTSSSQFSSFPSFLSHPKQQQNQQQLHLQQTQYNKQQQQAHLKKQQVFQNFSPASNPLEEALNSRLPDFSNTYRNHGSTQFKQQVSNTDFEQLISRLRQGERVSVGKNDISALTKVWEHQGARNLQIPQFKSGSGSCRIETRIKLHKSGTCIMPGMCRVGSYGVFREGVCMDGASRSSCNVEVVEYKSLEGTCSQEGHCSAGQTLSPYHHQCRLFHKPNTEQ